MKPKIVYLHGSIAEGYPEGPIEVYARSAREIASFFEANFGDFYEKIRDQMICIIQGDEQTGDFLDEEQVDWTIGPDEVHIMPEAEGAKRGGMVKAIIGAVLIGVAIFASGGTLAGLAAPAFGNALGITGTQILFLGAGLMAAGFASMVQSNYKEREAVEDRPSSLYQGALNTQAAGNPVPYVAGRNVIVGGQVIHASLDVEQL